MRAMFRGATGFNQPLMNWQLPAVTDVSEMFFGAKHFDGAVNDWSLPQVINANRMFFRATRFDQNLNGLQRVGSRSLEK